MEEACSFFVHLPFFPFISNLHCLTMTDGHGAPPSDAPAPALEERKDKSESRIGKKKSKIKEKGKKSRGGQSETGSNSLDPVETAPVKRTPFHFDLPCFFSLFP
jgi:hypothetical protein